jgi:hypothetical protein
MHIYVTTRIVCLQKELIYMRTVIRDVIYHSFTRYCFCGRIIPDVNTRKGTLRLLSQDNCHTTLKPFTVLQQNNKTQFNTLSVGSNHVRNVILCYTKYNTGKMCLHYAQVLCTYFRTVTYIALL